MKASSKKTSKAKPFSTVLGKSATKSRPKLTGAKFAPSTGVVAGSPSKRMGTNRKGKRIY